MGERAIERWMGGWSRGLGAAATRRFRGLWWWVGRMFVDEITYLVIGGESHDDNYSAFSLGGTLLLVVFVFIFKEQLVGLFALFSQMVAH